MSDNNIGVEQSTPVSLLAGLDRQLASYQSDPNSMAPAQIPLVMAGRNYILREANGKAAAEYRNATFRAAVLGEDGKAKRLEGLANAEPLLVSMCLFEIDKGIEKAVPLMTILAFKYSVIRKLFEKVVDISELQVEQDKSKEALEKQKADIDKKLKAMGGDNDPKKEQHSTETGSS